MTTLAKQHEADMTVHAAPTSIEGVLDKAMSSGMTPEALEKVVGLYERMADRKAKAEFSVAMAEFKRICPPITRRTENAQFQVTYNGSKRNRRYASLEDIESTIRGPLGKCGLAFRWGNCKMDGTMMTMTCEVSHIGGHSEASAVSLPVESRAGCSEQQKFGSAMTYAQRYSLIQALGLTSCDEDNDGNEPESDDKITPAEAEQLERDVNEVGGNLAKMLEYFNVKSTMDLPARQLDAAYKLVEKKRRAAK